MDECRATQDEKDIDDVAAQDVGDGNLAVVLRHRHHIDYEFGHGGSESHYGESDDKVADPKSFCQSACAIHKPVRAEK